MSFKSNYSFLETIGIACICWISAAACATNNGKISLNFPPFIKTQTTAKKRMSFKIKYFFRKKETEDFFREKKLKKTFLLFNTSFCPGW
jgi:hypothetical protein